jgi:CheY-like chemotaxis protein
MGVAGQMKVLIIEDEPKAAAYLKKGLTENGFVVDVASDGQTGLHQAPDNAYDVIACDVMLPRVVHPFAAAGRGGVRRGRRRVLASGHADPR